MDLLGVSALFLLVFSDAGWGCPLHLLLEWRKNMVEQLDVFKSKNMSLTPHN
jgi:hypothetical protein